MNEQEQEKPIGLPSHSPHFPASPTLERMNLACKEAASQIEGRRKSGVYGGVM